jgi:uncharacterized phage-like protein YoqJ
MDDFYIDRARTVCFSGHRPEKLPQGKTAENMIKSILTAEIIDSVREGFDTFISGGARGIDTWAGCIVTELKQQYFIRLICVIPFPEHGAKFTGRDKFDYGHMLKNADKIIYSSESYVKDAMKIRNQTMVDMSGKLIAVMTDPASGTGQTVRYAERKGIAIKLIGLDKWLQEA